MSALRLARGHTGRDKVLKFDGCYHGHSDSMLVAGGSGVAQMGLPGSAGVTGGAVEDTIVAPYNVVPTLDERHRGGDRRTRGGEHEPRGTRARVPRGPARRVRPRRRALDLRRGDHGLSPRPRRRRGVLRGDARPLVLRQGHRRGTARRGLRRLAANPGFARAPRGRSTRRARCRATPSRPPPASRCLIT